MNTINIDSILNKHRSERLFEGGFGIEKENVRVTPQGNIAKTPHPTVLGNKRTHPYITTDFSESQIELITPVRQNIHEAIGFIETLHDEVSSKLNNEFLWPQSMPPILPEKETDIPIASYDEAGADLEAYRKYLAENYGHKKQLISGIHFNVSFNEALLEHIYKSETSVDFTFKAFREQVYLKTLRNFKRYRWLLITLLSNSPVVHQSYVNDCVNRLPIYNDDAYHLPQSVSMRNSMCGYRNKKNLQLNYDTISDYKKSIEQMVNKKLVKNEKENYSSIRIKMAEASKEITHLEVRMLDLNPFIKHGIDEAHLEIIHQFLIYCLLKTEANAFDQHVQQRAFQNHEQAASFSLNPETTIINDHGQSVLINIAAQEMFADIHNEIANLLPENYQRSHVQLQTLIEKPEHRPSHQMLAELKGGSFIDWSLNKAKRYADWSQSKTYNFYGLEDMELSTQLLMREAIFRGIDVDIMDRTENFIKLNKNDRTEYVMQATRTSLDNYSSVLLMENKVMTKKVLEQHRISVPQGSSYSNKEQAIRDFIFNKGEAIVVKPKSTNFGLGITIIKENHDPKVYQRAIEIAFSHDNTVLIERFVTGKEYRFFVINNKVEGILHRVPANIVGDGKHTIAELVAIKNEDPLRGKGYKTPLEKLSTGEAESMFLATQNRNFETIPKQGETIFLRENSNISTGGDSIDFTDDIHPSYHKIAIDAARALNVSITGLDMMIDDITTPATPENYAIIEMNFNPAIHIHCHPFKGINRALNKKILDALGYV